MPVGETIGVTTNIQERAVGKDGRNCRKCAAISGLVRAEIEGDSAGASDFRIKMKIFPQKSSSPFLFRDPQWTKARKLLDQI